MTAKSFTNVEKKVAPNMRVRGQLAEGGDGPTPAVVELLPALVAPREGDVVPGGRAGADVIHLGC